jgi:hypothetical protein
MSLISKAFAPDGIFGRHNPRVNNQPLSLLKTPWVDRSSDKLSCDTQISPRNVSRIASKVVNWTDPKLSLTKNINTFEEKDMTFIAYRVIEQDAEQASNLRLGCVGEWAAISTLQQPQPTLNRHSPDGTDTHSSTVRS